jgi:hypothetical protein
MIQVSSGRLSNVMNKQLGSIIHIYILYIYIYRMRQEKWLQICNEVEICSKTFSFPQKNQQILLGHGFVGQHLEYKPDREHPEFGLRE